MNTQTKLFGHILLAILILIIILAFQTLTPVNAMSIDSGGQHWHSCMLGGSSIHWDSCKDLITFDGAELDRINAGNRPLGIRFIFSNGIETNVYVPGDILPDGITIDNFVDYNPGSPVTLHVNSSLDVVYVQYAEGTVDIGSAPSTPEVTRDAEPPIPPSNPVIEPTIEPTVEPVVNPVVTPTPAPVVTEVISPADPRNHPTMIFIPLAFNQ